VTAFGGVNPALFCDLYELTMAAGYVRSGVGGTATFELFVRSLPEQRNFLVAAGLRDVLIALDQWVFDDEVVEFLATIPGLDTDFVDHVRGLRFTGELRALPEGEIAFAEEPLLEVTAPLLEAQLLETLLLNVIGTATMQASKAVRVALAVGDRSFADFSARRDHGVSAAMSAARTAMIAGAASTSLVAAGDRYGVPLSGTMAHAYVMSFADERDAFRTFARTFPTSAVLLLDTWDTMQGAQHAVEVARELSSEGIHIAAVRLDSGDLDLLSRKVREVLDAGGCSRVRIVVSGDLDEYRIAELVAAGAPIDAFGVGTRMGTSADAPYLGVVYKLVEDESGPKLKLAEGKATWPGRKQVFRHRDHDVLGLLDEDCGGRPLLTAASADAVEVARDRCRAAVADLPEPLTALAPATPPYVVDVSPGLRSLRDELVAEHQRR
jgi:nicotinate phosphoribosyltransferase